MSNGRRIRRKVQLQEALRPATLEQTSLVETIGSAIREAPAAAGGGLVVDLVLIEAGWNQAGTKYYSPEVLARDIPTVFPAGTHQYIDHPTATETFERPERSLLALGAVLIEDPYTRDGGRTMRAKARVYSPYAPLIREAWQSIGVSINAQGEGYYGERDGRQGLIVEAITVGRSVDFVTRAGAGGRIVALLESARSRTVMREARTVGAWLESRLHLALTQYADDMYGDGRLTRDERIALSSAIGDGLAAWTARVEQAAPQLFQRDIYDEPTAVIAQESAGAPLTEATADETRRGLEAALRAVWHGEDTYVWVRDFDPDRGLVWYELNTPADGCHTWQEQYAIAPSGAVQLAGQPVQVVQRVVYEPVTPPAGDAVVLESASAEPAAAATDVTDGAPPTAPNPPIEEAPVSGTQTGAAPPVQAGTAEGTATAQTATTITESAAPAVEPAPAGGAPGAGPAPVVMTAQQFTALTSSIAELQEAVAAQKTRGDAAEAANRALTATNVARETTRRLIEAAQFGPSVRPLVAPAIEATVLGQPVPLLESGAPDVAAIEARATAAIDAQRAYATALLEAQGVGQVTGLGTTPAPEPVTEAQFTTDMVESFKRLGLTEAQAAIAARGRSVI